MIDALQPSKLSETALVTPARQPANSGGVSFDAVRRELFGQKITAELQSLESRLAHGPALTPRELLLYQIKLGQVGLRVELVSKVAESAMTTLRKLQNQSGS